MKKKIISRLLSGVYGFVNFGHFGHGDIVVIFAKKAGKNLEKKIISKRNNFEKSLKKTGVVQKYKINYA